MSRDSHSSRKARGQLLTDRMHRELDPAALNTAPGAFINKRAVYFIVLFVFQRKVHVISPLCLEVPGCLQVFSQAGAGRASPPGGRASPGPSSRAFLPCQPLSPELSSRRAGWWGEAAAAAAAAASFSLCLRAAAFFSCSAWLFMCALRLFTL